MGVTQKGDTHGLFFKEFDEKLKNWKQPNHKKKTTKKEEQQYAWSTKTIWWHAYHHVFHRMDGGAHKQSIRHRLADGHAKNNNNWDWSL